MRRSIHLKRSTLGMVSRRKMSSLSRALCGENEAVVKSGRGKEDIKVVSVIINSGITHPLLYFQFLMA